ncbi:hypothetical protein CALVIDRAFT_70594 [Calocera viscosa TUFC12733]|uniref:Uncharacterized protein n=1 Tax=Calocera viscosa (strain TUFC12733) TaxID=1330018 RepID=A0A167NAD5_CALVF|nr:hypothetical protein CALVIDRAFT_70594 [Calocera viscosa TUFC12733]
MIVWAGPGKFGGGSGGSPPDCSDVVFWIFRHTPSAADRSLRAFALFAFAAGSLVSVVLAVRALQWNWWARREALARLRQEQADAMARRQASSGPLAPVQDAVVQDPAHVGNGSASGQVPSGEPTGNGQAVGDRNEHGNGNGGGQLQLTGVIHSYPPRPVGQPSPNGLTQPSRPPLPPEQGADGGQGRPAFINRPLSLPWAFPPIVLPDPWNKRVPTLLWIAISSIVIASWVYIIVTTEMTITANQERSQTSVFSLGQIMSLVLLLDQVVFQGMTQIYEKLLRDNFAHAQAAGYFALEAERQGGRIPMVPPPPAAN